MTADVSPSFPIGKSRSKVSNVISAYHRISKAGIHYYTVYILIHVFIEIIKFHGIVVSNAAFWRAQVKLLKFHDLGSKPEICFQLFEFKARTLYGSYIYISSNSIFFK